MRHLNSPIVIDQIRVSNIARPFDANNLGIANFQPDRHTTLLISFDKTQTRDGKTYVLPDYAATELAAIPVEMPNSATLVPGKIGNGYAVSPDRWICRAVESDYFEISHTTEFCRAGRRSNMSC